MRNSTAQDIVALPSAASDVPRSARQVLAQGARIRLVDSPGPVPDVPASSAAIGEAELVLRADALAETRRMTEGISGVLALLRNIDRLAPGEPEHVRIEEIAALFTDIADFATYGARRVRQAADAIRVAAKPERASAPR